MGCIASKGKGGKKRRGRCKCLAACGCPWILIACLPRCCVTPDCVRKQLGVNPGRDHCATRLHALLTEFVDAVEATRERPPWLHPPRFHNLVCWHAEIQRKWLPQENAQPPDRPRDQELRLAAHFSGPGTVAAFSREAERFMEHAYAVYGVHLGRALDAANPGPTGRGSRCCAGGCAPRCSNKQYYLWRCSGLKPSDIAVLHRPCGQSVLPGHALVADHEHKAVVLSIRGACDVAACLADVLTKVVKFPDEAVGPYSAPSGMVASARELLARVRDQLKELLQGNPTYKLVLTGHGLGAGTAVLLTYLLLHLRRMPGKDHPLPAERAVQCFAYAAPPVLSQSR